MRLAVVCRDTANAYYRAVLPMKELERRGHAVTWPGDPALRLDGERPRWQLLHLHQAFEADALETIRRQRRLGVAVVWDSDDDISAVPKGSPAHKRLGGRRGVRRQFERSVEIAKAAHLMTTTSESIAGIYREQGVERVAVIGNHLWGAEVQRPRRRHAGIVIGCVAAAEHSTDLEQLGIPRVLEAILRAHPDVRLVGVGVDLRLRDPRYTHLVHVPITRLVEHATGFDIGIAPLIDSPLNRSRSDVKVKEYASAGAAWLASPRGPYVGLGEEQGGELVRDDQWFAALDRLVGDPRRRAELSARARAWAARQTMQREAGDLWVANFRDAIQRARAQAPAAVR